MGVRGLTTFIASSRFSKEFKLHDMRLIIDGNCVMTRLFFAIGCEFHLGGSYMRFADRVSEFFDNLLMCGVKPLVILDGGIEDRKLDTIIERKWEALNDFKKFWSEGNKGKMFPLLGKYVFLQILQQKNISLFQTVFEADEHIASIAKALNCPVLSNDSDFIIYDCTYIPFYTLQRRAYKTQDDKFFIKCEIFDKDSFYEEFAGTDKRFLLPLVAAILGNDYLSSDVFHQFLSSIRIPETVLQNYCRIRTRMIVALLRWLQKYTINNAIAKIVSTFHSDVQQTIVKKIETVINEYLTHSPKIISEILDLLGYTDAEIKHFVLKLQCNLYKFESPNKLQISGSDSDPDNDSVMVNINLKKIGTNSFTCKKSNNKESENEDIVINFNMNERKNSNFTNEYITVQSKIENKLDDIIPLWFKHKFRTANLPSYFMDIINRQHIFTSTQMENLSYESCSKISLKVICIIFRLLSNGTTNAKYLKYTTREGDKTIKDFIVDTTCYKINFRIPLLHTLPKVALFQRKQILLSTLGVSSDTLDQFPPDWKLFIAVIKYWVNSTEKKFSTNYHLYAVILLIIFKVVREKIESKSYATNKKSLEDVSFDKSINDALDEVTDDCYFAKKFFKSKSLICTYTNIDIDIVHAFTLLQNCLRTIIDLNNLLNYPYPRIDVVNFFSGTILYNLVDDLRDYKKLNGRIYNIFQSSPSVLQLFVSISVKIKSMFEM